MAVHEITDDGSIKEIDKITGGPYGGINVNREFENLLDELFGAENLKTYREQYPSDWLAVMNDFEGKKQAGSRIVKGNTTNIRLPATFASMVRRRPIHTSHRYGEQEVKFWKNEYLCLSQSVMKMLFKPVLDDIKEHLKVLQRRQQVSKVKTMLLVGGFANSALLRQEMLNEFSHKYRVLIPHNAAIAVVQGAVLFGKNPAKITERVVSTTYGADCTRDFDKTVHPIDKLFMADGRQKCKDLFNCFVKENDVARSGQSIKKMYSPLHENDTEFTFGFYITRNPDCKFVTDPGVTKIGSVKVQSPDISKGRGRDIEVSMHFGGTEIVVTAVDISSGCTAQTTLDFFHK